MANNKKNKKIDMRILIIVIIISILAIIALISSITSIVSLKNKTYKPIINWGTNESIFDDKEENENKQLNELIKSTVKEYINSIYVADVGEEEYIPDFTQVSEIPDSYLVNVIINELNNPESKYYEEQTGNNTYTYDKLNSILVDKFGQNANQLLPRNLKDSDLEYDDELDAYVILGHGYSENISRTYVIDQMYEKENKIYVDMYEYCTVITDENDKMSDIVYLSPDELNGKKVYYEIKNLSNLVIKRYTYGENTIENEKVLDVLDENSNSVKTEDIEKVVLDNKDKFIKRTLEIVYDSDKDMYNLVASYTNLESSEN